MTVEEALGKITDPEAQATLKKVIGDQNSYITKLETQLREQKQTDPKASAETNDVTKAYILKRMREDVIKEATAEILASVSKEVFEAVKPDFDSFLEKNMKGDNVKKEFAIDAFNLVYGRCFMNPSHPLHNVGKNVNPNGTPTPQPGTNGPQIAKVQNIVGNQPQVMSNNDVNSGQGLPGVQGTPVLNTRDAFKRLKEKTTLAGGNKFQ